jgi:outer membrane protein assembly factor BamB
MGRLRWVGLVVFVASLTLVLAGCDWTQFGSGPGHTFADPVDQALSADAGSHLTTAWSTACTCLAPIDAGGIAYVADGFDANAPRDVTLRALDDATGATRWSTTFTHVLSADFLAVGNGLAYVSIVPAGATESDPQPSSDILLALDATTGAGRWLLVPPAAAPGISNIGHAVLDGSRLFVETHVNTASALSAIDTTRHVV